MAMGNTTVDPKNTAGIGCSIITVNNRDKGIANKENGPKFSVKQGEEILEIGLSTEKCTINEFGEIIRPDGAKTGSKMSEEEQERYANYRKNITKMKEQKGFEH